MRWSPWLVGWTLIVAACTGSTQEPVGTEPAGTEPPGTTAPPAIVDEQPLPEVPLLLQKSDTDYMVSVLEAARRRWSEAGIGSYRYTIGVGCFCPPLNAEVTVIDGRVASVRAVGEADQETVERSMGLTIEELIADISEVAARDPDDLGSFTVSFDTDTGRPINGSFDPSLRVIDDEWSFQVSKFTEIRAESTGK